MQGRWQLGDGVVMIVSATLEDGSLHAPQVVCRSDDEGDCREQNSPTKGHVEGDEDRHFSDESGHEW